MSKHNLRIDWATHKAVKHSCETWHYSKSVPVPPLVKIGAWEDSKFIGVVVFSRGANNNLLKPFRLKQTEGCELTRIALTDHENAVSRIAALAIKFLCRNSPGMRLVVSFADPSMGHHGGIYQAMNWIYTGRQKSSMEYIAPDGKQWHGRMVSKDGWTRVQGKRRQVWQHDQCTPVERPGKHRYLMPLDTEMRDQVSSLAKPYPKRVDSIGGNASGSQLEEGGSTPTSALHSPKSK